MLSIKILKLIVAIIIILAIVVMPLSNVNAASIENTYKADALKKLGLFLGTDAGYELDRGGTRTEGIIMLLRLLGQDDEAVSEQLSNPFTDVPTWAKFYVGYAYKNEYTKGVSSTLFGAGDTVSSAMYLTLVLRSLGYSDVKGDFKWDNPYALAISIGILPSDVNTINFLRADIVSISWAALEAKLKNTNQTLANKMIQNGVFSTSQYEEAKNIANAIGSNQTASILSNEKAKVDVSRVSDGYVRIAYTGGSSSRIKVLLSGPDKITYSYDLKNNGTYEIYPLSSGNGYYDISVCVNISGTSYSIAYSAKNILVTLKSEFAPYLASNQFVNFDNGQNVIRLASSIVKQNSYTIEKVKDIYNYVTSNITYDYVLAATVQSGYIPNADLVLQKRSGICFDYAALMAIMLRSQNIPTKLVVGYEGTNYHAWISTYTVESGWIDNVIFFDGHNWKLMDPTYGASHAVVRENNYFAKYYY